MLSEYLLEEKLGFCMNFTFIKHKNHMRTNEKLGWFDNESKYRKPLTVLERILSLLSSNNLPTTKTFRYVKPVLVKRQI